MLLRQDQRQSITQRIDPKIILANNILQLTVMEMEQSIEVELQENPALETLEEAVCQGECIDPASCPFCRIRIPEKGNTLDEREGFDLADVEAEYEPYFPRIENDDELDFLSNLESEMTLQEHLASLVRAVLPCEDHAIGEYLAQSLDHRGWLDGTVENISIDLSESTERVERVLKVIQSLDPPGVGARTLQECLLIQIRYLIEDDSKKNKNDLLEIAEKMVCSHFDLVTGRRYPKLARALHITEGFAKQVVEFISTHLNPYPASQFRSPWNSRHSGETSAVRPDVVIKRTTNGIEVDVPGMEPSALNINPTYRMLYKEIKSGQEHHSADERKHIVEYVERAEQFLRNMQHRRHTLRRITQCIVEHQAGFLETGSRRFIRPLTRTRVAEILGIHESTVSRATANKYVQLPNLEVVGFNIFFNASLSVKDTIEQLIEEENPAHPLSDQQIVHLLEESGIHVARRTVVKYREARKILSSNHRRR